jgi:hypothetical protein
MTYAAAYGPFLAAVVSMHGDLVRHTLALGGDGGGVFGLDSRGPVTVTEVPTTGPPADGSSEPRLVSVMVSFTRVRHRSPAAALIVFAQATDADERR